MVDSSGGTHGFVVGHIVPEAQEGGVIALLKDGDTSPLMPNQHPVCRFIDQEIEKRRINWVQPPQVFRVLKVHKKCFNSLSGLRNR